MKSVQTGDIDADNSDQYIKQLIQQDYIGDASVVMVLLGPKTKCRKHVDWEISAGLNTKVRGASGLLGVLLPEFPLSAEDKYQYDDLPARLADNVKSEFAKIYTWSWITEYESRLTNIVEEAFNSRVDLEDRIDNSRLQMQRDTCA